MTCFEIKTNRLVLKPICMDYLESTHEYASDPGNCTYMLYLPNETLDMTRRFIERAEAEWRLEQPAFYELAVLLGGKHIGGVSLSPEDGGTSAELGWIINRRYHNRGYASEAAAALMEYAARHLGIKRFIAHCDTENKPSERVMIKLGMTKTAEYGGRRSRNFDHERREYLYERTYP